MESVCVCVKKETYRNEMKKTIDKLQSGKAASMDGITAEMLKRRRNSSGMNVSDM